MERFWEKVDKTGDCWLWTGARLSDGYGAFWLDGRNQRAHRVSFELATGRAPHICRHTCDTPLCVNPDHLLDGTRADNARDAVERGQVWWRGSAHHFAKLTADDVVEIRRRYSEGGVTCAQLGREFRVSFGSIARIVRRESWRHV